MKLLNRSKKRELQKLNSLTNVGLGNQPSFLPRLTSNSIYMNLEVAQIHASKGYSLVLSS